MLVDSEIQDRIQEGELMISDFNPNTQITPTGVELTVGESYRRYATDEVYHASMRRGQIVLKPNTFYHLHTVESIDMPDSMYGRTQDIVDRSLEGIRLTTGVVDPGYSGRLILAVENVSGNNIVLEAGDKIVQMNLYDLSQTPDSVYEGNDRGDIQ